ncbi:hypothetical protein CBG46_08150 [Actinobacillus succinogenes]|uniref:Uncharacterized protein n=1 Tax=Actinobacillus succinogenes (strain ATCC 55618 / DSM 22257 / CCUG 43843 / 130Z) TaxID=339671 RepID=A6VPQ0_ACTSZ|nr:hypothetical protein [Actinobacillus succinogenes]ABR74947.1 hypothetical protein Asuc_1593 [Actinobacillus succinogenes 130Z]PHI40642.1 hypothetical protein CBG46_08150 [Actinobacillus succinogenes]
MKKLFLLVGVVFIVIISLFGQAYQQYKAVLIRHDQFMTSVRKNTSKADELDALLVERIQQSKNSLISRWWLTDYLKLRDYIVRLTNRPNKAEILLQLNRELYQQTGNSHYKVQECMVLERLSMPFAECYKNALLLTKKKLNYQDLGEYFFAFSALHNEQDTLQEFSNLISIETPEGQFLIDKYIHHRTETLAEMFP